MYIDDCNLNGDVISSYDDMAYHITKPNNQQNIVWGNSMMTTPEQLGQYLVDNSYIDYNCSVIINDGSTNYDNLPEYPVVQGKFIIPATIEPKE